MYNIILKLSRLGKEKEEIIKNKFNCRIDNDNLYIELDEEDKEKLFEILSKDVTISLEVFEDYSWGIYFLVIENSSYKLIDKDQIDNNELLSHINKLSKEKYNSINEYVFINHNELSTLYLKSNEITERLINHVLENDKFYKFTFALTRIFNADGNYIKNEKDLKEKLCQFKKPIINLILLEEYIGEVNSGGHEHYFNNSSVYGYKILLENLREMKLYEYKAILEAAAEIFKPNLNKEDCCKELNSTEEKFVNSIDEIFYSIDISKREKNYLTENIKNII